MHFFRSEISTGEQEIRIFPLIGLSVISCKVWYVSGKMEDEVHLFKDDILLSHYTNYKTGQNTPILPV